MANDTITIPMTMDITEDTIQSTFPQQVIQSGGGGGAVDSVNGMTGDVVLTASDLGAYELPSGGIPDTDLSSSVRTSHP